MRWLVRQGLQGRTQRVSCFLPGTFYFAEFLGMDYDDGRIIGRTINDFHPGRENLEQSA